MAVCAEEPYFKVRTSIKDPGIPAYAVEECAKTLAMLNEPRLLPSAGKPRNTVYRLVINAAFGDCFCVRIQQEGEVFRLWSKRIRRGWATVAEREERVLSKLDSKRIQELLAKVDFFKMLSEEKPMSVDGELWLLEGVHDGQYNVVEQLSVGSSTEERNLTVFYEFCKFLIEKDGLKETPKNLGNEIFR